MKQYSEEMRSLEIIDIAFPDGFGVAKQGELVWFVPGALPGDVVQAKMVRRSKRFGFAQLLSIERESPFRIEPVCAHTQHCGGCVFQDLQYEKQLELKQNYLVQTLRRIGNVALDRIEVPPILPSVEQYYYRSKVELFFGDSPAGAVGFRERVSPFEPYVGRLVEIRQCPIFSTVLERLLPLMAEYASRIHANARGRKENVAIPRKLVIREAKWNKRLMVSLVYQGNSILELPWLLTSLQREVPEIASLWTVANRKREILFGSPFLEEMIAGFKFRMDPETFFQPNAAMAGRLYESIGDVCRATGSQKVLGLYCGTGPIEISLSPFVREVVGIDSNQENIAAALENRRSNQVRNCRFYRQKAEQADRLGIADSFDLVIVDPPRAGLTGEALRFITGAAAPRLIYVSCNPSTLARDLKHLADRNFIPIKILPFDFFPHTAHLETLVLLEKRERQKGY